MEGRGNLLIMEKKTESTIYFLGFSFRFRGTYLSKLIMGICWVIIWVIGVMNLLTKSPDPPSTTLNPPTPPTVPLLIGCS